jgi:hypothetical protein
MSPGDIFVSLDAGLASRMQEIMMRSTECEEGAKFEREHPSKRRAGSRLGRAICAYQGVMTNMAGTLSDLVQTNFGALDFIEPIMNSREMRAFELTQKLMEEYGVLMDIQAARINRLAAYIFFLTFGVIEHDQTLGTNNKIPGSLVRTSAPTNTPS